jgi:hypothetical protein
MSSSKSPPGLSHATIIDCPWKHRSTCETEHRLEAYATLTPSRRHSRSTAIAPRMASGRPVDSPEGQCSIGFQPVFRPHHRATLQVSTVLPSEMPRAVADRSRARREQTFSTLCCISPGRPAREGESQMPGFTAQANSSRTIKIDRFNLAIMAVHVQSDGTATDFAILNRGKRAGRSVNDRGEDRSAVGANNA